MFRNQSQLYDMVTHYIKTVLIPQVLYLKQQFQVYITIYTVPNTPKCSICQLSPKTDSMKCFFNFFLKAALLID